MTWEIEIRAEAVEDYFKLDGTQQALVLKRLEIVRQNPLPKNEGGYGEPLGSKADLDLRDCLKVKLVKAGIRVIYTLERSIKQMKIVVIGMRADLEVYREAAKRLGR